MTSELLGVCGLESFWLFHVVSSNFCHTWGPCFPDLFSQVAGLYKVLRDQSEAQHPGIAVASRLRGILGASRLNQGAVAAERLPWTWQVEMGRLGETWGFDVMWQWKWIIYTLYIYIYIIYIYIIIIYIYIHTSIHMYTVYINGFKWVL